MELTIHIGPHKTGTTAIQTAFAGAAATLRRRGVLYPRVNWMFPAQHRLAFALKGKPLPGGERPDATQELDALSRVLDRFGGRAVLLSSEEFFACPPDAIARLHARVGPARIVTFLRKPDDFLLSCYNQKTKQPGNGFSVPVSRFIDDPRRIAPEMDYRTCVTAWADVFGDEATRVELYEDGPPLARLRQLMGTGDLPCDPPGRPNASVPGPVVELMRHAKAIGMDDRRQKRLFVRARDAFAASPPFDISADDRAPILAAMESDLDCLFARFGRANPYPAPAPSSAAPPPPNATIRDAMRLLESLL